MCRTFKIAGNKFVRTVPKMVLFIYWKKGGGLNFMGGD